MSIIEGRDAAAAARWSVGGAFLEALANRDYTRMAITLAPNVRFRALLPPGPQEFEGPDAVTAASGPGSGTWTSSSSSMPPWAM